MTRAPIAVIAVPDVTLWVVLLLVAIHAAGALAGAVPMATGPTRPAATARPDGSAPVAGFWATWAEAASH